MNALWSTPAISAVSTKGAFHESDPCSFSAGGLCPAGMRAQRFLGCSRPQRKQSDRPLLFLFQPEMYTTAKLISRLRQMFQPLLVTLIAGATAASPPWQVYHGICSVGTFGRPLGGASSFAPVLHAVKPGDVFVWIGEKGNDIPWQNFSARGARTVYYATENHGSTQFPHCDPSRLPMKSLDHVDEIWSFDWRNVAACRTMGVAAKYVPPGALPLGARQMRANLSAVDDLVFLGKIDTRSPRQGCLDRLKKQKHVRLRIESSVWTEANRAKLFDQASTFLQLSQEHRCNPGTNFSKQRSLSGLDTFRVSQLVSHGALMIGHRTHPLDEEAFSGIMTFSTFSEIGAEWRRIQAMSLAQRERLADERVARFRERMSPQAIFERAGIYATTLASALP